MESSRPTRLPAIQPPNDSGSGFGLPPDLLAKSRRRVRVVGLLTLAAAGADMLLMVGDLVTHSSDRVGGPSRSMLPLVANAVSVSLSLGLIVAASLRRIRDTRLLDLTLAFEVLMCLVISLSNPVSFFEDKGVLPVLTWVTPLIILFPLIVPYPPRRVLLAAVVAALTAPLGLFVLRVAGEVEADASGYLAIAFGPALAVMIAHFGSRVVYQLGLDVAAARQMGAYRLERLLGRGGMGEVWLARHQLLARPAAIKLVRPELIAGAEAGRETALLRFEREAQSTAAMRSPHTIGLYDFGVTADGTFYYVMELLEGLDAESLIRRFGPIPPERAVHLLRQVCHSLAEAHEAGLIHRDIKPANLYLCRYGRDVDFVKVLDFGLVKAVGSTEGLTGSVTAEHAVCGTPAYMAPELVLGQPADERSDIYALGCVAYWLLTGQLVFPGDTPMQVLVQHAHAAPEPVSQRSAASIPPALGRLVMDCLEKDPARRPRSAAALAESLACCEGAESWTPDRAKRWWHTHQPQNAAAEAGS